MRVLNDALTGAISAVLANSMVYPLDVITARQQLAKRSLDKFTILKLLYRSRGLRGIYTGISVSLFQTFCSNFTYFYFYSWIKYLHHRLFKQTSTLMELLMGALAGGLSRSLTTPISVITTRKQLEEKETTYIDSIDLIYKEDGIVGFWRGYQASLVLTVNPAITYGLFERLQFLRDTVNPFFLGAMTKSLATVVTYPYILVKTRLQASNQYNSLWECMRHCIQQEGPMGLYKGIDSQLTKSVLCQAILFWLKDVLTRWRQLN
ncbi:mitochondrial carrier domain-containing protein [Globomyces pollinis-pini]|nr:mitochondrial carrier domain-containing protein [Globomyces pollinis-pini]